MGVVVAFGGSCSAVFTEGWMDPFTFTHQLAYSLGVGHLAVSLSQLFARVLCHCGVRIHGGNLAQEVLHAVVPVRVSGEVM